MTVSENPHIRMFQGDCMEAMKSMEDNAYELAIVDPPYGRNCDSGYNIEKPDRPSTWNGYKKYGDSDWDIQPDKSYWDKLLRVSKNQIVCGGNYFTDALPQSNGWAYWSKKFENTFNFSHGEFIYTSTDRRIMEFRMSSKAETRGGKDRIHPTQKPIALYKWLLTNYATEGDRILDTHGGSGSIAIACYDMGFDLDWYELDTDYYAGAVDRFNKHKQQGQLFRPKPQKPVQTKIEL